MKKLKIWFIGLFFLFMGVVAAGVNDTKITVDYFNGVYGNFLVEDIYYWNQIGIPMANGKVTYCLEPGVWITTDTYDSYTNFNIKNISDTTKEKLEKYSYYGYDYPSHQTIKYYLATQELIWRELGIKEMYWSTKSQHNGDKINVENEKSTILKMIEENKHKPSFDSKTIKGTIGGYLVISDSNKVVDSYSILETNGLLINRNINELIVNLNKVGKYQIKLKRNFDQNDTSILYTKPSSQTVASFRLNSEIESIFNVEVDGYEIELDKIDEDNKNNIPRGEAVLKGAIYEVFDKDIKVGEITTDEKGVGSISNLDFGTYQIKEKTPSVGYLLDKKVHEIEVKKNESKKINIEVTEKVIESEIEFIKVFAEENTGVMKPEINITFEISNNKGEVIKTVITDEYGRCSLKLPYGTYTVSQKNTTPGYEYVKDFKIEVKENIKRPIVYTISNAIVKAKLKLIKVDEQGNTIKVDTATFKIKDKKTGLYVSQEIYTPDKTIINEYTTNNEGEVTLPYPIISGTYLIEEIKTPAGFLTLEKPVEFTLDENTGLEVIDITKELTIKIKNKKPVGEIIVEKLGTWKDYSFENEKIITKENSELLNGVEFSLIANEKIGKYKKGDTIKTAITENGTAVFNNLELGSYCIKEIKGLDEYKVDDEEHCVTLTYKDEKTPIILEKITVKNYKDSSKVTIKKVGEQESNFIKGEVIYKNIPLTLVEFEVYNEDNIKIDNKNVESNTLLFTLKTDNNGIIEIEGLPFGKYYLKEKNSNNNYYELKNFIKFEITKEKNNITIPIKNIKKKSRLIFSKLDKNTKAKLKGAKFKITKKDSNLIFDFETNKQGVYEVDKLPIGTYEIVETDAPFGYRKSKEKKIFNIDGSKEIITIEMENEKLILPNTSSNLRTVIIVLVGLSISSIICFLFAHIIKRKNDEANF